MSIWKDLFAFLGFNILYATYLELNPNIGGIIVRPNSEGKKSINLGSYINFIKQPITTTQPEVKKHLWNPKNWDINYPVCATAFMLSYKVITYAVSQPLVTPSDVTPIVEPFFK